MNFLANLWREGLQYNTINGYRSAISALHVQVDGAPIGQHPLVKRVMTGVFNERTPQPRYTRTWDVGQVLEFIKSLGMNRHIPDKLLTYKVAMLLALTTACRASELRDMNLEFMTDTLGNQLIFGLPKPTKTTRPGNTTRKITLVQYEKDSRLDVVACVRAYVARTTPWRLAKEQHQLLLGISAPHKPVVTCTIANWLKRLMEAAGVDTSTFKAHSTRAAATSKAHSVGLSVSEIVAQGNWTNAGTFHRFYRREVEQDAFAAAVLQ